TRDKNLSLCQAEREVLGATHADVGAYLLGLWGLPDPIVEATAFHHDPARSRNESFSALTAVHAANALVLELAGGDEDGTKAQLDLDYLARVGVADRITAWRSDCHNTVEIAGGVE
ncbi:MAG: HDOD domain-containing protein, partial [Phycisphaerae bacterium]